MTKEFVDVKSVSRWSNAAISDLVEDRMKACGLEVERLTYEDENGELKVSLVGRKGEGEGAWPSCPTRIRCRARSRTGTRITAWSKATGCWAGAAAT